MRFGDTGLAAVLFWTLATAAVVALYALAGWIVWAAWDAIGVGVFGAPALTYWQTCGVLFALGVVGRFIRGKT